MCPACRLPVPVGNVALALQPFMVLLLTLEEQRNPARRQHKRQRSHGIAQAAVAHGLVRSRIMAWSRLSPTLITRG